MTTFAASPPVSTESSHLQYLRECLKLARKSPPRPTNFRVGALLVLREDTPADTFSSDKVLSTGYTLELPGNTHAEQCCLANYAAAHGVYEEQVADAFPSAAERNGRKIILYVTMEPCAVRLSGNTPCVERIIRTRIASNNSSGGSSSSSSNNSHNQGIDKVYFGVKEPGTFVGESQGCKRLTEAGIEWDVVSGLEDEILAVATAGHNQEPGSTSLSQEELQERENMPRNPKKRVMDTR